MKKLVLLVISLFLINVNVYAGVDDTTADEDIVRAYDKTMVIHSEKAPSYIYSVATNNYEGYTYYFYSPSNSNIIYPGFCIDQHRCAVGGTYGTNKGCSYATETTFNQNSSTEELKYDSTKVDPNLARNIGIMYILNDNVGDSTKNLSLRAALRVYNNYWKNFTNSNDNYACIAKEFFSDSTITNSLKNISSKASVYTSSDQIKISNCPSGFTGILNENGNTTDYTKDSIKSLVSGALKEVEAYLNEEYPLVKINNQKELSSSVYKETDGTTTYSKILEFSYELKNIDDPYNNVRLYFNCPKCEENNVKITFVDKDGNNIGNVPQIKDGENIFYVKFDANSSNYNGSSLDFYYKVRYYSKKVKPMIYKYEYSPGYTQRFYVVAHSGVNRVVQYDGVLNLTGEAQSCEQLKTLCQDDNESTICKKWWTDYPSGKCDDGVNCEADINTGVCTNEETNIDIKEGYAYDDTTNCNSEENILKCVINKSDDAGNSYIANDIYSKYNWQSNKVYNRSKEYADIEEALDWYYVGDDKVTGSDSSRGVLGTNKLKQWYYELGKTTGTVNDYCSISCKEDYNFTMPGAKDSTAGGYFTLAASMNGSKTCYTSKIAYSKFESDIEVARKVMLHLYNAYNKINSLIVTDFSNEDEDSKDEEYNKKCQTIKGACSVTEKGSCVFKKKNLKYQKCDDTGCNNFEEITSGYYGNTEDCDCDEGTDGVCTNYEKDWEDNYEETYKDYRETLQSALDESIILFGKLINQYNECGGINSYKYSLDGNLKKSISNGWVMDYNYDPTMKFTYTDDYMTLIDNNSMINNTQETDENKAKKINKEDNNYKVIQNVCENVNDKYDCTDNEKSISYKDGKILSDDSSNNIYEAITYTIITGSKGDYEWSNYSIMTLKKSSSYIRQTIKSESSFITPTLFKNYYTSGLPLYTTKDIDNTTDLEENGIGGLPTSLKTKNGVYRYAIKIGNLGEYYDGTNRLGRILGDNSNSVVVSDFKKAADKTCVKEGALKNTYKNDTATIENGVYVCRYNINVDEEDPSPDPDNPDKDCDELKKDCNGGEETTESCALYKSECCISYMKDKDTTGYNKYCTCPDCPSEIENPDDCPDGNCPSVCENCLVVNGKQNYNVKQISLSNINPTSRTMGSNWNVTSKETKTTYYDYVNSTVISGIDWNIEDALAIKAAVTTDEIITNGESIYDVDTSSDETDDTKGMSFYVKLTPKVVSEIKDYNSKQDTFTDDSLTCYDYKGISNLACYSSFIDKMIEEYGDNFKVINTTRPKDDERNGYSGSYWTSWTDYAKEEFTNWNSENIEIELYYKQNNFGPAWK